MVTCPACGRPSDEGLASCPACGAEMDPGRRQPVTVLFCDIAGSTEIAERLDPEPLRELLARYFHAMRSEIERNGGVVEKFIGDAVVAIFGVPLISEDDPERAVRAAWSMQARIKQLAPGFTRRFGTALAVRIGINSGEVVAGDPALRESIVTGDAVNVAARLEQVAGVGEIVVSGSTLSLVTDLVRVEPLGPIQLRGKTDPVPVFRVLSVERWGRRGPSSSPFVGRDRELRDLTGSFERAREHRAAALRLVVAAPGVGKSRLAVELEARLGTRALIGRCPAASGSAYQPLLEIVAQTTEASPSDPTDFRDRISTKVASAELGNAIADRISLALGLEEGTASAKEILWAFRRFLEIAAEDAPLLVILDDLHWAGDALLELVDEVASSGEAPLMILALARPEFLDRRPDWGSDSIRLQPLAKRASARLVHALSPTSLSRDIRDLVVETAGGNPLFIEEIVRLTSENDTIAIPPTIDLLLTARLDALPGEARHTVERASIEGERFHVGGVLELVDPPVAPRVPEWLELLARLELITPDRAILPNERAYRFRHALIRDATYRASLKSVRASLHERFAGWLEQVIGERAGAHEETIGSHLELAYRYHEELGTAADHAEIAPRAARWLANAGQRAAGRGDSSAVELLERALALLPDDHLLRPELQLWLAEARWGRFDPVALPTVEAAIEGAAHHGLERVETAARLTMIPIATHLGRMGEEEARLASSDSVRQAESLGDDRILAKALLASAISEFTALSYDSATRRGTRSLEHARRARSAKDELDASFWTGLSMIWNATPVETAIDRLGSLAKHALSPATPAILQEAAGILLAMAGRPDRSEVILSESERVYEELGLDYPLTHLRGYTRAVVAEARGDIDGAERALRRGCEVLDGIGETSALATWMGWLACFLLRLGRWEEAERSAQRSRSMGDPDDLVNEMVWRRPLAVVRAHQRDTEGALTLAREALEIARRGDSPVDRGLSWGALAAVARASGDPKAARRAEDEVSASLQAKGAVMFAADVGGRRNGHQPGALR